MSVAIEYLAIFDLIILGFLLLRNIDWCCGIVRLAAEGGFDPSLIHDPKTGAMISGYLAAACMLGLFGVVCYLGGPDTQLIGLFFAACALVVRWLSFVANVGFASAAILIAGTVPAFAISLDVIR